jgi:uncharacterized small protein (DUF1192 family)
MAAERRKPLLQWIPRLTLYSAIVGAIAGNPATLALPPATDLPEEILRTQIILEARSPLNGEVLSAAEYAELIAQLEAEITRRESEVAIKPSYKEAIFLLRIRRVFLWFGINIRP